MEGLFVDRIYEDIARRTDGDIYIGVVGPVRTGKSTFIKRFMETQVIPGIENVYRKERARDELPQSGSGRTIMTAEPKFVPEEAVDISLGAETAASVRLIDCVGYMVPGAEGLYEDGAERMVTTPWYDHEIPMTQAAEEGTHKVIAEHSTIGLVITTDGSFGDIPRENYTAAEERVIRELQAIGKPFAVVLNSASPASEEATALATELSQKYGVPCMALNCQEMTDGEINAVMKAVLFQFPLNELSFWLPAWAEALPEDSELKQNLYGLFLDAGSKINVLQDVYTFLDGVGQSELVSETRISGVQAGIGTASAVVELENTLYYRTISEQSGYEIQDDGDLMELLRSLKSLKQEYDHVHEALTQARETGYGIIMPGPEDMVLEEPKIISRGGKYSVRLKASAPAIHLFQTQVETEVSPAVGGEKASEQIVSFLLQGFDGDINRIWESNIFGKSLYDIAEDGLTTKLHRMPNNIRNRLRTTIQRLVNDGGYSLICIII
ncbi:MAG: stage IV sporulation protein A [Oscillospiraceae bacterium]|nr:stage IV sporulation protein A [Oscillospiraceae bacterium]